LALQNAIKTLIAMKTQHGYFIGVYDLPNYCSQFVLFAQFGRGDHNAGSADWDKFATKKV
jgi:hypothetical protein